jgi:tau tubulin kinase
LEQDEVLCERFKVGVMVGQGTFSRIFEAEDLQEHRKVAVKIEKKGVSKSMLKWENQVLRDLQGSPYVCTHLLFTSLGGHRDCNILVMNLFEQNVSSYRKQQPNGNFQPGPAATLALHMLQALRYMHGKGFVHRDIKPSNFLVPPDYATRADPHVVIVDFGLAKAYVNANGVMIPQRTSAEFRGSSLYASLNAHYLRDLGRADDLWSFFFLLVDFVEGNLPWRDIKHQRDNVQSRKEGLLRDGRISEDKHPSIRAFAGHLFSLEFGDEPDYEFLEGALRDLATSLASTVLNVPNPNPNPSFQGEATISVKDDTTAVNIEHHITTVKHEGNGEYKPSPTTSATTTATTATSTSPTTTANTTTSEAFSISTTNGLSGEGSISTSSIAMRAASSPNPSYNGLSTSSYSHPASVQPGSASAPTVLALAKGTSTSPTIPPGPPFSEQEREELHRNLLQQELEQYNKQQADEYQQQQQQQYEQQQQEQHQQQYYQQQQQQHQYEQHQARLQQQHEDQRQQQQTQYQPPPQYPPQSQYQQQHLPYNPLGAGAPALQPFSYLPMQRLNQPAYSAPNLLPNLIANFTPQAIGGGSAVAFGGLTNFAPATTPEVSVDSLTPTVAPYSANVPSQYGFK